MVDKQKLFSEVWAPASESSVNAKGTPVERGARALLKKASFEHIPSLEQKEAMFSNLLDNPGPSFKRVSFAI